MLRALTLCLLLPLAAAAQDAPAPPPDAPAPPADAPATQTPATPPTTDPAPVAPDKLLARPATVNGQAITSEDVVLQLRLLVPEAQQLDAALRQHLARKAVAEEMLLSREADRLGAEMADRDVDAWWERRTGNPPDWTAIAAAGGITVTRQRELARRTALADLYLMHRVGLRADQSHKVPPDPMLERVVTITPSQLREAFAQNHQHFDRPELVTCDMYVAEDEAGRDALVASLASGTPPLIEPVTRSLPVSEIQRVFPAEIADWVGGARAGESRVLDPRTVLAVRERLPAKPATFAEAQDSLRNVLMDKLLREARQHLLDGLVEHATYWPADLFAVPKMPTGAGGAAPSR